MGFDYLIYSPLIIPYIVAVLINKYFWRKRLQITTKYWAVLISLTQIIFVPLIFFYILPYSFILLAQIKYSGTEPITQEEFQIENYNANIKLQNPNETLELTNPNSIDTDGDGLSNVEEQRYGTNPENGDTDNDGLSDFEESQISNPLIPDSDADGLSDYEELKVYYTKPLAVDTDDDGYKDGDEVKNGYNPLGAGKLQQLQ